jgi:uncharacterized membrane protein YphA (DoxX/SURF4 family)
MYSSALLCMHLPPLPPPTPPSPVQASYLLPTSVIMHNFWDMPPESQQYQAEMVQFMKNVAIMGGLLVLTTTFKAGAATKDKQKWA